jgi:hypothetical protein
LFVAPTTRSFAQGAVGVSGEILHWKEKQIRNAIANLQPKGYVVDMASNASKVSKAKPASRYAGRSALTGQLVLKPASKDGAVTLERVREAIRRINALTLDPRQ